MRICQIRVAFYQHARSLQRGENRGVGRLGFTETEVIAFTLIGFAVAVRSDPIWGPHFSTSPDSAATSTESRSSFGLWGNVSDR